MGVVGDAIPALFPITVHRDAVQLMAANSLKEILTPINVGDGLGQKV